MGAGQRQRLADEIDQQLPGIDLPFNPNAIYFKRKPVCHTCVSSLWQHR
jgi:hypothetical protein